MKPHDSELELSQRQALPSEIAFLRDRYPQTTWQDHENYGELAAFWLEVHTSLRAGGRVLQRITHEFREGQWPIAAFQQRFTPALNHYLRHLEGHHQIEDQHYFPRFRRLDRRMVRGFDLLENDHDLIHEELVTTVETARSFIESLERQNDTTRRTADRYIDRADRLLRLLERHLTDEEDLVIPAILEYTERPLR